ncbi:MAG: hypothetical protein ACOYVK_02075 [Bacillota bacterium]
MEANQERVYEDLDELKMLYDSLDEIDRKKLMEAIMMIKAKFLQRAKA